MDCRRLRGADLRLLLGRADRVDPAGQRIRGRDRRLRHLGESSGRRIADQPPADLGDGRRPDRRTGRRGCRDRRRGPHSPLRCGDAAGPCHDRLHLGHHGQAQGLRDHPREPDVRRAHAGRGHRAGRDHTGRPHGPVPATGPRPGPRRRGLQRRGRYAGRPLPERQAPCRRHAELPSDLPGGSATDLREDLQRLPAEGLRGGQGTHLRPGHGRGHRLRAGPLGRQALALAEGPACPVRPTGLQQAARRDGRGAALRHHGRGEPRCPARQLLRRHRADRHGGLRPHRDDGVGHLQPRRGTPDRLGRPAHAGNARSGSPTTARSGCAGPT